MPELRKTKIICTLGPSVDDEETLRQLILAGMNAARFNFSHGTHESQLATLQKLKRVRDELGRPVATILDTKGPVKDQTGRNLPGTDRCHQLFQVWNLPDIGGLINQAPHMYRQPAAVLVIGTLAQQVEQLRIGHADKKIERRIRIADDKEQRRFPVPDQVQLQLVIGRVRYRRGSTAGF